MQWFLLASECLAFAVLVQALVLPVKDYQRDQVVLNFCAGLGITCKILSEGSSSSKFLCRPEQYF
jgi:hypothetical protein